MKNQITTLFALLDVRVGQTLGHTILENYNFDLSNVLFLAIAIYTKVLNVLIYLLVESISPETLFLMRKSFRFLVSIQTLALGFDLKFFFFPNIFKLLCLLIQGVNTRVIN
jgi:hypothetical protein